MADPVLETVSAVQRDSIQTLLVDVSYRIYEPDGEDVNITVEWSRDVAGPWNPATAQPYDRKHTDVSVPLSGLPVASPGDDFVFVWNAFFDLPEGIYNDVFVRVTAEDVSLEQDQEIFGPFDVVALIDPTPDDIGLQKQLARQRAIARTPIDFLGNGLIIPFRRGSRDFVSAKGVDLIRSNVRQVLNTRAASGELAGELEWRPDFGNQLWVLRHRNNDPTLRETALAYATDALSWEPRVRIGEAFVENDAFSEDNEVVLRISYSLVGENVDENDVLIPNFEESLKLRTS